MPATASQGATAAVIGHVVETIAQASAMVCRDGRMRPGYFTSGQPPSFSGRNTWSPGTSARIL